MQAIETDRLVLRNFQAGDAADLFAYLRDPQPSCFYSLKLADMAAVEAEVQQRGQDDEYIAVCLKTTGRLIGDLFAMPEEDTFSVGWNFSAEFGGHGFALEAARALFDYLFTVRNARRLYAYLEVQNVRSRRLCERLGMRQEGLFVEFHILRSRRARQPDLRGYDAVRDPAQGMGRPAARAGALIRRQPNRAQGTRRRPHGAGHGDWRATPTKMNTLRSS